MVNPVAQVPQVSQPMMVTPVAQVPQVSQRMTVTPVAQVPQVSQMQLQQNRQFLPCSSTTVTSASSSATAATNTEPKFHGQCSAILLPGGGSGHQAPKIWKYSVSYLIHIETKSYLLLKVMHYESNVLLESNTPVYFIINLSYYSLSKEQLLKAPLYLLSEEQKSFRRRLQAAWRAKTLRTT